LTTEKILATSRDLTEHANWIHENFETAMKMVEKTERENAELGQLCMKYEATCRD
jgi:hypothetical protein